MKRVIGLLGLDYWQYQSSQVFSGVACSEVMLRNVAF